MVTGMLISAPVFPDWRVVVGMPSTGSFGLVVLDLGVAARNERAPEMQCLHRGSPIPCSELEGMMEATSAANDRETCRICASEA